MQKFMHRFGFLIYLSTVCSFLTACNLPAGTTSLSNLIASGIVSNGGVPVPTSTPARDLSIAIDGDNILDFRDVDLLADTYLNENFLGTETALSGWSVFDYSPVTPGVFYAANNNVIHSVWYDSGKNFISAFGNGIAPTNAAYVRVSIQTAAISSLMLIRGGVLPSQYKPYFFAGAGNPQPFLNGKGVFLGTSLTAQALYIPFVQAKTGITTVLNKGVSGQLVRTMADGLVSADLQGASFVSIEGSTNDYGHGYSVAGQVSDSASASSLCGDVKTVVAKIRAMNATVKIFVMNDTPRGAFGSEPTPPAANPYGLTMDTASAAMMDVAAFLSLPHWDAYHLSGITQSNVSTYTGDNLHWNSAGAALVGNGYGDYINLH